MVKIGHRKEFHKLFIRQNEWQRANARSVSLKNCLGNGVTWTKLPYTGKKLEFYVGQGVSIFIGIQPKGGMIALMFIFWYLYAKNLCCKRLRYWAKFSADFIMFFSISGFGRHCRGIVFYSWKWRATGNAGKKVFHKRYSCSEWYQPISVVDCFK